MSEDGKPAKSGLEKLTPILILVSIALAFFAGSLWQKVTNLEKGKSTEVQPQPTAPQVSLDKIKEIFGKEVIKFGSVDAKLLVVEIADPSCPFCQAVTGKNPTLNRQLDTTNNTFKLVSDGGKYVPPVPEIKKLVEDGKAAYGYLYSPGHGAGEMGMKALYCAFEQGKFWEVHDKLMTNAGYNLMNETIKNDKEKAGELASFLKGILVEEEMTTCLKEAKWDERLVNDQKIASEISSGGTPNFFLNTTSFPGAFSYKEMEPVVTEALK